MFNCVCFAYSAFNSFFFVKRGVQGFWIFGEETQKRGAIFKVKTNLVQNYASRGGKTWNLCFECKTDEADFIDWMSFLPTNLMEEISPNPEALSANA